MYEPQYDEETGGGGFVFGMLVGAALGAAVGLMFAPKAGSQLRQSLYDGTADIRRKANDAYGQAVQTANDYVQKGREAFDRGREAYRSGEPMGGNGAAGANVTDFTSGSTGSSRSTGTANS